MSKGKGYLKDDYEQREKKVERDNNGTCNKVEEGHEGVSGKGKERR